MNRQKRFRKIFRFHEDIDHKVRKIRLRAVLVSAESKSFDKLAHLKASKICWAMYE